MSYSNDNCEATLSALSDENSTTTSQSAVSPQLWFWSAFISVERLPGVRFSDQINTFTNPNANAHAHGVISICTSFAVTSCSQHTSTVNCILFLQVALRRLSNGPPKHRRKDGCDDSCLAARFLACDGLEQANRLAILAVPFARVLADVHRRKVQGSDAWLNWDWFIRWQHDKAQANLSYSTVTSDTLIRSLHDWLPPRDWIGWRCGDRLPSLLHGDATCDNSMITWQHNSSAATAAAALTPACQATSDCAPLVSLIDFADCRIGPALYDLVAAWLSGLSCSPTAIKSFRAAYTSATGYDPLSEAFAFASRHPFYTKGTQRCIRNQAEMFLCMCMLHLGARGALTALEASGCAAISQGQSWDEVVAHVAFLLV